MDETEERAKAALRSHNTVVDALSSSNFEKSAERDRAVAQNILREEIGFFGPYSKRYGFDEKTRDVLLAHGRQDAAHAMLTAISMSRRLEAVVRRLALLIVLCTLSILAAVWWTS